MKQRTVLFATFEGLREVVALSAVVRDLHVQHPGLFLTDVYTPRRQLWAHNPLITTLPWEAVPDNGAQSPDTYAVPHSFNRIITSDSQLEVIVVESSHRTLRCSAAHASSKHLTEVMTEEVSSKLGSALSPTALHGHIVLHESETSRPSRIEELGVSGPYWLVETGSDSRYSVNWWPMDAMQQVVNACRGLVTFVQVGLNVDYAPALEGVVSLVGCTDLREILKIMYHADGVVCGNTALVDIAAAVPVNPNSPYSTRRGNKRPCVVIAGGDSTPLQYRYPHHEVLQTLGKLSCCQSTGCGKRVVRQLGEGGDEHPADEYCTNVVRGSSNIRYAACRTAITPQMVIDAIHASVAS
jgi:hypothetical protein